MMDANGKLSQLRSMMLADFEARQRARVEEQKARVAKLAKRAASRAKYRQAHPNAVGVLVNF